MKAFRKACLFGLFAVCGCVSSNQYVALSDPNRPVTPGMSRICVVRPSVVGGGLNMDVYDHVLVGGLGPHNYLCWETTPGTRSIVAQLGYTLEGVDPSWSRPKASCNLNLEPGKEYCFQLHYGIGSAADVSMRPADKQLVEKSSPPNSSGREPSVEQMARIEVSFARDVAKCFGGHRKILNDAAELSNLRKTIEDYPYRIQADASRFSTHKETLVFSSESFICRLSTPEAIQLLQNAGVVLQRKREGLNTLGFEFRFDQNSLKCILLTEYRVIEGVR